ncbi:hypothetical protein [Paenibacillus herberti]|uniref:Uncharacterized protein n=1 Tax=Paenibacillus herberti TaxID=1619309 RepID=A0A229P1I3_9BACL|nr:hypothetical protein [Paenibacillus herberti]OXM15824.1 hypothetical protein CGZ75_03655 [Paenibacillus herberti]
MVAIIRSFAVIFSLQVLLLYGCSVGSSGRSPEELFSLTVSGLSAREVYHFKAESNSMEQAGKVQMNTAFDGVVQRHNGLQLKQTGGPRLLSAVGDSLGDDNYNPSALLDGLLKAKSEVKLDASRSDAGTACLVITPDAKEATRIWRERLDGQWQSVRSLQPEQSSGWSRLDASKKREIKGRWGKELEQGERVWSDRMNSLAAQASYELLVDRKRLVPISLKETSKLAYRAEGKQTEENRRIMFQFQSFR